jgi:arylsulfatase
MHAIACSVDDGTLFHPLWAVADRRSRKSNSLPATEITMAETLREAGYATAMFGKWHLGAQPYSQPQNKGFDEFYGIPPGDTWDAFLMVGQGRQTKSLEIPLDKGPQIVEAKRGEPLKGVKALYG